MLKILASVLTITSIAHAASLYPDLKTATYPLRDNYLDTITEPGKVLLRFSNGVANVGKGRMELRGGEVQGDGQKVYQRIYNSNGSYLTRLAGTFTYHPQHHHTHFNGFAHYKLREIEGSEGVGPIVAEADKTSFCLVDESVYNSHLPNFRRTRRYTSCGTQVQGISVGWVDVYNRSLYGQWIDVTDVPSGEYWLESTADPDNRITESNESNNTTRVRVSIEQPSVNSEVASDN